MSSKKHRCELDLGSDSMLPESKTRLGWIWRKFRKLGQLSMYHPETPIFFRSYSAVIAERQRQLLEEGHRVIHPLSLFSIFWTSFMAVVNLSHMTLIPFRLIYVLQPLRQMKLTGYDEGVLIIYLLCLADIVVRFNIGYVDRRFRSIIVDWRSIACRYISTWFFVDLVSCTPVAFVMLAMGKASPRTLLVAHVLPLLRIARICSVISNVRTVTKLFSGSYIVQGVVRLLLLLGLSAHWSACLMYLPPVVLYYWTGQMPPNYNYFLQKLGTTDLLQHSIDTRYTKAIVIVISAFFGTGFSMFHANLPDELLIHSCIIMYAAMFMVFTLVFIIKSYLVIYDSKIRYNGLMNQVGEYMEYRQFPVALKKRVEAFYEYRYQKHYFKEENNLNCLTDELRDEVRLQSCRNLIDKVKLFENIPASTVGTVLGCLHPEVYLANDLVVAAGEVGHCMYFICTGTVAVYSLKGVEICHLEDGAHFGEVALLVKDCKRSVTVVAVETTQMYRLNADDFKRYMSTHPMLNERIESLAARRMHETVLVDEAFRQERERHLSNSSDHLDSSLQAL